MRLSELFELHGRVRPKQLDLVREYAMETIEQGLRVESMGDLHSALGSSGSIKAVVAFAARGGKRARLDELSLAIEELAEMSLAERKRHMDPSRASVVVAGSAILEALMLYLKLDSVRAVDRGLREGVLIDLVRRQEGRMSGASLEAAALRIGRKLRFDESHARQVRRIALQLFDELRALHKLPASARQLLDAAALLHDVGKAVSDARHHKHSYYLLTHVNIAGLPDREREIVACIARYHDRSPPDIDHAGMRGLDLPERRLVRKLATLLRVADSLDCSHHQSVLRLHATCGHKAVTLRLKTRTHVDLELWDSAHEAPLFRRVFGRKLVVRVG
jgi:exopolyphosphatase/guanosine-5'-triphosphate,3'-diphosphate pyrophosphatase